MRSRDTTLHLQGAWRLMLETSSEERAQATLEYALTVLALLAIISGLALLWRAGEDGTLARLIEEASSHALGGTGPLDMALY